jgi:tetratricopeptide (TPR) repeat protein
VHQTLGDYSRAETYRQQELRTTLSLYGEQSQEAASSFVAAAELHLAIGDVELAIQEQRRAISIIDGLLRKSSERRSLEFKKVGLQEKLAIMLLRKPDVPAAIRLQLETIELARSTLGTNFEKFVNGLEANLALGYLFGKEYDKSEKLYRQVLSRVSADSKLPPAAVPSAKLHLATLYAMMDRLNEAEPLYREALASTEQSLGKDAEFVMLIRLKFGELLARKGEFKLAEELLQRRLESESKSKGPDNASRRVALCRLVMLELDRRQPSAALGYAREVEVIRPTKPCAAPTTCSPVSVQRVTWRRPFFATRRWCRTRWWRIGGLLMPQGTREYGDCGLNSGECRRSWRNQLWWPAQACRPSAGSPKRR